MNMISKRQKTIANKSKEKIEWEISLCVSKFLNERMGEQVQIIATQIIDDIIILRIRDLLSLAEKSLLQQEEGIKLIKELKTKLMESLKDRLENLIKDLTGIKVVDTHISFGAENRELVIVFSLSKNMKV